MEKVELLAPCGGMEQLKAAIEAGADVVSRGKRKTLNVQLSEKLDMGDGIEIRGGEIGKRRISGNIVTFIRKLQKNTYIIGDISGDVRPGDFIYRISEKKQMVEAKKLIQSEGKKIPVDTTRSESDV